MRARAFFEKARDAAKLLDDLEETEQRARASAELQAQQYTDTHGGGDDAEPPALKLLELAEETADAREAARLTVPAFKRCSGCGRSLPASEFHKHKRHTDGLQSRCKECQKARRRVLKDERRRACEATA